RPFVTHRLCRNLWRLQAFSSIMGRIRMEGQMTNTRLRTMTAAFGALFLLYTPVLADDWPGPTDITIDQARDAVEDAGYTNIRSLEFDDGRWEVDARDDQGRKVEVTVDAATGKIIKIDR